DGDGATRRSPHGRRGVGCIKRVRIQLPALSLDAEQALHMLRRVHSLQLYSRGVPHGKVERTHILIPRPRPTARLQPAARRMQPCLTFGMTERSFVLQENVVIDDSQSKGHSCLHSLTRR